MINIIILIVEDNKLNSQLICESLDRMGYSKNHVVDNFKSALEFVDKTPPDLILMDIMLKGSRDGVTIASQIQSKHDIPIIYITGYAKDKIIERVKDTNPYAFIKKPFKYEELKANVQIALSKHKSLKQKDKERLKYEQAFSNMHCGAITTDMNGSVLFINKIAELLTGFKSHEVKNLIFENVFQINNGSYNSRKLIKETIQKGTVHKFKEDIKIKSKKGSEITLKIKSSIVSDKDNNFITIFFWEKAKNEKRELFITKSNVYSTLNNEKINIMVVGDNSILRKGILSHIESDHSIDICYETTTKLEILECCYSKAICLAILLDDSLEPDEIFETINFIKNELSYLKILVLYPESDNNKELKMMEHAVNGVVSYKDNNVNILLAIHSIISGDLWFRRQILNQYVKLKNSLIDVKIKNNDILDLFNEMEKKVVIYVSRGYRNKEIALKVSRAEATVKMHLSNIYKKLNIRSRTELISYINSSLQ